MTSINTEYLERCNTRLELAFEKMPGTWPG